MRVRAIAPADGDNYRSILERTTDEDRYCRFFHAVDHFAPEFIERYVERRPDMIGFIAEENGVPLGAAHGVRIDERTAELAIVVARDVRRRGVAKALMARLFDELANLGYTSAVGYSLRANVPFVHLAKSIGMRAGPADDGLVVTWRQSLTATTTSASSAVPNSAG